MAEQSFNDLLTNMQSVLEGMGYATRLGSESGVLQLKARLTGLGLCRGEALMELTPVEIIPDEEGHGRSLLQFYTTTAADLDQKDLEAVMVTLNDVNLRCPFGSFHVYEPLRQLYHRYTAVLPQGEDPAVQAIAALRMVLTALNQLFDETILIANGATGPQE